MQDTVTLSLWRHPAKRTFVTYTTLKRTVHLHMIKDFPEEGRCVWTGWVNYYGHQVVVDGDAKINERPVVWRGNRNFNMTF